jgi:hypothetical protein
VAPLRFKTDDEGAKMANDTSTVPSPRLPRRLREGLVTYFYCRDIGRI